MESTLTRKENITLSAIQIVDELGIQGLSIRELAKRQNITEAAIYRHFNSKEEIVLSILDFFYQSVIKIINSIELNDMEPKESILYFIQSHTKFFEENPSITSVIFSEEIFRGTNAIALRMKEIFDMRTNYIIKLVNDVQQQNKIGLTFLGLTFSSEDYADIILGLLRRLTLKWRLSKYTFPLTDKTTSIIENLLEIY